MTGSPLPPSFFCVGAQKAGTTALHNYLARHPDIFLPGVKETHFFNDGHGAWHQGYAHYLRTFFSGSGNFRMSGEIDPEYFFFPETAGRIAAHVPDAKLIFMFREPVSRAYSHYWMIVRRGLEKLEFAAALEQEAERMGQGVYAMSDYSYVSRGYYHRQLQPYLASFPRENMLFLLSEDMHKKPEETLEKVYLFLGVESVPYIPIGADKSNQAALPISMKVQDFLAQPSGLKSLGKALFPQTVRRFVRDMVEAKNRRAAKFPPMPDGVRKHLLAGYRDDTLALGRVIDRDLSSWVVGQEGKK
jgi:hypothetical protein